MKYLTFFILLLFFVSQAYLLAGGKTEDSGGGILVDSEGRAIYGVDVVAYAGLDPEAPGVIGIPEHSYEWRGARWLFSSRENLENFRENPERYAPEYGGYCAYALAGNKLAKIDPDSWTIHDGKLYLNFDGGIRKKWLGKLSEYIEKANRNWPEQEKKLQADGIR